MVGAARGTALVRRPGPRLAEGIVTHIERTAVDVALAVRQWDGYVEAMRAAGWDVIEVPPADDCPDAAFVEDTVVVHRGVAVVTRPGAEERRAELSGVERALAPLGLRIERIEPPGTLDGGDVLKVGETVYVGQGGRTNADGVEQLRRILGTLGVRIVAVPLTRVLHLKSAVTALPDGSVIGHPDVVDDPAVFPRFLPVAEASGAHVVLLGGTRLLMAADCPRTAEQLEALGYDPVAVDISEYQRLEGCVTCLSVRIRPA